MEYRTPPDALGVVVVVVISHERWKSRRRRRQRINVVVFVVVVARSPRRCRQITTSSSSDQRRHHRINGVTIVKTDPRFWIRNHLSDRKWSQAVASMKGSAQLNIMWSVCTLPLPYSGLHCSDILKLASDGVVVFPMPSSSVPRLIRDLLSGLV